MKNALTLLCLIVATPALAIPDVVTWAARVENDAGAFNGNVTVSFELFDVSTAGTSLWSETVTSAVVVDGDLVHDLGSIESLDDALINRDNIFLQVTMNGDVLAPRNALRAVPYALRAEHAGSAETAARATDATKLGGLTPAAFQFSAATGGGLALTGTQFSIQPLAVTTAHLADGAVTAAKLAPGSVTAPAIASASVTATAIAPNAVSSSQIVDFSIQDSDLATDIITLRHINGTTNPLRPRPSGCGGGLQFGNGNCRTTACAINGTSLRFLACDGSCSTSATAVSCPVEEPAGRMLPVEF